MNTYKHHRDTTSRLCRLALLPRNPLLKQTVTNGGITPHIRITELLWDVARHTGFLESFTDSRSGRKHANPAAILAPILAGAKNLGLERMAKATENVTHAQLSCASTYHLHPENYSEALAKNHRCTPRYPFRAGLGEGRAHIVGRPVLRRLRSLRA